MFLFIILQSNGNHTDSSADLLKVGIDVSERVLDNNTMLVNETIEDNDNAQQEFLVIKCINIVMYSDPHDKLLNYVFKIC